MSAIKIKKGDLVKVIAGKDKDKEGKVIAVDHKKGTVTVEGANMITKHTKPSPANQQGGIVSQEGPMDVSNVMLVHNGKTTKIGYKVVDGKKVRVARATGEVIDSQIAQLHKQRKRTFYASLSLEFIARIVGCLEVYFILYILTNNVSFLSCILIMAFTSLFSNLFFFSPMQLGAREGGFALAAVGVAIPSAFGVYTGLVTRVRELIWITIGVLLMKVGNGVSSTASIKRKGYEE